MRTSASILLAILSVGLLAPGTVTGLDTPVEGYDASERPQFRLTSVPRLTRVPGVFEITNSMRALIKEDSIRDVRVSVFAAEWISGGLGGPICPERPQVPSQGKQMERPCNPIESRTRAIVSFFAVDPSDFGVGYGYKLEPLVIEQQPVRKLSGLSGSAPAYMPIYRIIGIIPTGMMPKFSSNPGHAPAEKLEVISQLSIGGFKSVEITGDIAKDNAVFQTRSMVSRSSSGLYTYTYEVVTDHKRWGVAFNWTSVRTPQLPGGWKGRFPKESSTLHEIKDRTEAPLLVNDPAFVSFGKSPKFVEEIAALAIAGFPVPPALRKDVPLKSMDFHKARDNASGDMQLGETTVSAVFRYLQSVNKNLVDYMFLAPAFVPDTSGSAR